MPISEAQKRASINYIRGKTDELKIRVDKGKKADLQAHAANRGESLNGFVNRAIDNQIGLDKAKDGE